MVRIACRSPRTLLACADEEQHSLPLEALAAALAERGIGARLLGARVPPDALREVEAKLADWQQRWDAHAREQSEATRAADVERTRVDYLDRQALDAERRREQLAGERGGLDVTALAASLSELQVRHDEQKTGLDGMAAEVESRKQAVTELQDQQRAAQAELSNVRREAQEKRGRLSSLETLQNAALGQEQGAAAEWLRQRGLDSAARVGETLQVEAGWENAVESALGQLIEGVLVESPETLVDALGELGEGRLTLVAPATGDESYPATSLAAKVRGPAAIRRILGKLHAAETLADAGALLPRLGEGESVITRAGERLGAGWPVDLVADGPEIGAATRTAIRTLTKTATRAVAAAVVTTAFTAPFLVAYVSRWQRRRGVTPEYEEAYYEGRSIPVAAPAEGFLAPSPVS